MKLQWIKLCESLAGYGDLISKTLECLPATKKSAKIRKCLSREWDQITKTVAEIDLLIDPVNPVDIDCPFTSERFKAMWKYYKDYLVESHHITLTSRVENARLTQLYRFSGKDEERAMLILETLCANNYRNIVCPTDKQLTGEEPAPEEQQQVNLSIIRHEQDV